MHMSVARNTFESAGKLSSQRAAESSALASVLVIVVTVLVAMGMNAHAAPRVKSFQIAVNKSRIVHLSRDTDQISVGNPEVADIRLVAPRELYLLGHSLGTTNVSLGSKDAGFFETLEVEVTHDLDGLKSKLHELVPNEHPKVFSSQGAIVLAGEISSVGKMDAILQIAETYVHNGKQGGGGPGGNTVNLSLGGLGADPNGLQEVAGGGGDGGGGQSGSSPHAAKGQHNGLINLMQVGGPQQVMLEVKVAEMNRTLAKNLKVNFDIMRAGGPWSGGAINGRANVPSAPITDFSGNIIYPTERIQGDELFRSLLHIAPAAVNPGALFSRFISSSFNFGAVINAGRTQGLVKILAEPTLTTISGQTADFLSGGEFPIPVQQNAAIGGISIVFKEFGVGTKFNPIVLDSGRISLKLAVEVSELVDVNTVIASVTNTASAFRIPSLTKRRANSSVELDDGQTIGIAGMISDNLRDSVNKFPGLGEVPVLGQLFSSQEFQKNQTELVIFVTPRLARPMPTSNVKLPTDNFVEPDDVEYYIMGRTEGRKLSSLGRPPSDFRGGVTGTFGQDSRGGK